MPPYLRRWAVQGRKPCGDNTTTIFDLLDHQHVVVFPATVDTYAVTIDTPAVHMLAATASSGTACAVPAEHATHGRRLLGLRPHEPSWLDRPADAPPYLGPMVYRHEQLRLLATTLTEIADSLT